MDTRLGSLAVHLDTPQCFSAEMYSADLNIPGKPEDDKVFTDTLHLNFSIFQILFSCHFLFEMVSITKYLFKR